MTKRKILAMLDSPTCATGFAQVARNILKQLHNTGLYDIDVIGINHYGDPYDLEKYPYYIVPANIGGHGDIMGMQRLTNIMNGNDKAIKPPFDIFFTINDPFVLEKPADFILEAQKMYKKLMPKELWFKWIAYYPVDSRLKENWVETILKADYPVAYTQYGKDQMTYWKKEAENVEIIPHGVDIKTFFPISKEERQHFRKNYFEGLKDTTFLVTNISRNQPRKDIMRTLLIFRDFNKRYPDSRLCMHMKNTDAGGTVEEMAEEIGLPRDMFYLPENFNENSGVSLEVLNKIYNASDVLLTTTLGEGWGFINTESMAVKRPIVAPANTSIPEIFGGEEGGFYGHWERYRGIPMKCGTTPSEWFTLGLTDYGRMRPLTNVEDGVEKLVWVYENPEKVQKIVDNGYHWVKKLRWEKVCTKWVDLFERAYQDLEKERKEFVAKEKEDLIKKSINKVNGNNI